MKRVTAAEILAAPCHTLFSVSEIYDVSEVPADTDLYSKWCNDPNNPQQIIAMPLLQTYAKGAWYITPQDNRKFWIWERPEFERLLYGVARAGGSMAAIEQFIADLPVIADTSAKQD